MRLSPSDWVLFSPGRLYGAPFVSKHLLYRLYDIGYSLLLYQEDATVATTEVNMETGVILTRATPRQPKIAYLHLSPSATSPLLELGRLPSVKIPLFEGPQEKQCLNRLTISVEPIQLPSSQCSPQVNASCLSIRRRRQLRAKSKGRNILSQCPALSVALLISSKDR